MMQVQGKRRCERLRRAAVVIGFVFLLTPAAIPATKKLAVVVSAGSKLSDIPLANLISLCKGVQKALPDVTG